VPSRPTSGIALRRGRGNVSSRQRSVLGRNQWAALLLASALVASGCGGAKPETTTPVTPTTPSVSASDSATDIEQAGATKVTVHGDWLSAGEQGVWLSDDDAIHRLDPKTGKPVAKIPVRQGPCEASDVGLGSVWTATCESPGLARIDPKTNRVAAHARLAIPLVMGGEASIGVGANSVWLVVDGANCDGCRVARVEPKHLGVIATVPVSEGAASVRFGEGFVWVTNPDKNLVEQIDPKKQQVIRKTEVGPRPRFFAVGEGAVWTLNQGDGSVTRIDPKTGQTNSIPADDFVGDGGDMTAGGGWVWVRGGEALLARIDPRTNKIVERYGPESGSGAAIVGYGAVWVSAHDIDTVWRLPLPTR
jgi:virginiamycin B lyase